MNAFVSKHSAQDDTTACLVIGVMSKTGKKMQVIGSTINYGLQRDNISAKVALDFNKGQLVITTSNNPQSEVFSSLPAGPLYPVFQNKTNSKNSLNGLKLHINFTSDQ